MLSTDKPLTNNNLNTDDTVVKNMAVGNKETLRKMVVGAAGTGVAEQDSTLIEKQTESKPELPFRLDDDDEEENFFGDEDEEFCAEIENFVASQSVLDERANNTTKADDATVIEIDKQEEVTIKEQVVDFEEGVDMEEVFDVKEMLEQEEEQEEIDEKKEEVENLDQPSATTHDATDIETEQDMHEDASPTLITAIKQDSPSPAQPKKRGRHPKKTTEKATKTKKGSSKKKSSTKQDVKPNVEDVDEDEDEEPEYEIEKIISHKLYKGKVVKYEIKWKGYDESENTMEAANRMHDDVYELCRVYWDSHPEITRPSNAPPPAENDTEDSDEHLPKPKVQPIKREEDYEADIKDTYESDHVEEDEEDGEDQLKSSELEPPKKRPKFDTAHIPSYMIEKGFEFTKTWPLANTNWNTEMRKFHTIQLSPIDKNMKLAFIEWKNGKKTIHHLKECHKKCPNTLIQYYEERLRFV